MSSLHKLGDKVVITSPPFANQEAFVEKLPSCDDFIDMEEKWLEAGAGLPWIEDPIPDAYNVRLVTCNCKERNDCRHIITFLQECDIIPA